MPLDERRHLRQLEGAEGDLGRPRRHGAQSRARARVRDQRLEVAADGAELGRADVEHLARDVGLGRAHDRVDQVGDRQQGLRADLNRIRQALQDNKLPRTGAQERADAVANELDRVANEELEQIEQLLANARRENEIAPEPLRGAALNVDSCVTGASESTGWYAYDVSAASPASVALCW